MERGVRSTSMAAVTIWFWQSVSECAERRSKGDGLLTTILKNRESRTNVQRRVRRGAQMWVIPHVAQNLSGRLIISAPPSVSGHPPPDDVFRIFIEGILVVMKETAVCHVR